MTQLAARPAAAARRWRALDPVDRFWGGVGYIRVVRDLDVPPLDAVRRAVGELAVVAPEVGRRLDTAQGRQHRVTADDCDAWLDAAVRGSDLRVDDVQRGFDVNAEPLGTLPFRLVVGDDWVSIRMTHAMGDGWTVNALIGHVLRVAGGADALPLPWTVIGPRRRDAVIARDVARHLDTLVAALRNRRELSGGTYEPAAVRADAMQDHSLCAVSDPGFARELRRLRDERFAGASMSAVAMVGLRSAFAATLPRPRAGFECLFNTRSTDDGTGHAWGNWSAGVYIRPVEDGSPLATTAEMTRVRESGLAGIAHASLRARARGSNHDEVSVVAPEGAPRLTLSFVPEHAMAGVFPGLRDSRSNLGTQTRPNGVETITVQANELAGRLSLGISYYPDVWPTPAIEAAAREFLHDPDACLSAERLRALSRP